MGIRWYRKVAVAACALILSPADGPAEPTQCASLVLSEYCFPGGDLAVLVSVDQIMEHGLARARSLIAARSTPSQTPAARQADLTEMWQAAVLRAYDYAQAHSHRLDSLTVPAPAPQTPGVTNPLMATLHQGPLLRLNFTNTAINTAHYEFDGRFLINRTRLLHFMQGATRSGDDLFGPSGLILTAMLMAAPAVDGYVSLNPILQSPLVAPFLKTAAASDVSFMGALGMEMVVALSVAVEEAIRARSITLSPALHMYRDGSTSARDMDAPQVAWSGHLLLSDEALSQFSQAELELLMTHEAMHLMRPNFFLGLSAADRIQRQFFPQLNTERTATLLSNFLGRASPGKPSNCPVELAEDDELFIDYYVLQLYRDQPDKQQGYFDLLKRIHREFNPGSYSQAAFRVEFAEILMQHFAHPSRRNKDAAHQNQLFTQAILDAVTKNLPRYLSGEQMRLDDMLQQMEQHPDIALDAQLLRVTINYYRRKALLKEGWEANNTRFSVSCDDIDRMFRMTPTQLTRG